MEEPGVIGVQKLPFSYFKANVGFCFDKAAAIGTIVASSVACINFDGKIQGKAAHAHAEPEKGINALTAFARAVSKLPLGRVSKQTTFNIGTFSGGIVRNSIPDMVTFSGDIRSFDSKKLTKAYNRIQKIFTKECNAEKTKLTISSKKMYDGYAIGKKEPVVQKLIQALQQIHLKPSFTHSNGSSDANVLNMHGIQTVDIGYGAYNPHRTDEYMPAKNLVLLAKLQLHLATHIQ